MTVKSKNHSLLGKVKSIKRGTRYARASHKISST